MVTFPDTGAWIAAFREAPGLRLGRILRHADSISPYQRGTARDAVQSALKAQGSDSDTALLDAALAPWLEERLAETPDVVAATGWSAYLDQVMEGFSLSIGLPLPLTGALLRDRYDSFETWTESVSDEGPGDLYAAYVTALAHKQVNRRFLGLWYRLCSEAGEGKRPFLYLILGQLGLRLLPTPDSRPPVNEGLEGLTRWARHLKAGDEERFRLQWRAFAAQHPRTPDSWKPLVSERLVPYGHRPFAPWWRDEIGLAQGPSGGPVRKPEKNDTDSLIRSLESASLADIFSSVEKFVKWHERYVAESSYNGDIAKALDRVGNALLNQSSCESAGLAARLAVIALNHDPCNEQSWVLWAKSLRQTGHLDAAESVLWRAVERQHDNAHYRTVLAEILAEREQVAEAEALYRDTMRRFPTNPVCRLDLGLLLIARKRPTTDITPILQELESLRSTQAHTLRVHLEAYQAGNPLRRGSHEHERAASSPDPLGPEWKPLLDEGKVLQANFLLSGALDAHALILSTPQERATLKEQARAMLRQAMAHDPGNPVVRLIAQRHGVAELPPLSTDDARRVAGRNFALRLELAVHDRDTRALSWLWEDFPDGNRRALTACAWLMFDPNAEDSREAEDAARGLQAWLRAEPPANAAPAFATVHHELCRRIRAYALTGTIDDFLDGWNEVSFEDVRDLIDIGLLGMALATMPSTLYEPLTV